MPKIMAVENQPEILELVRRILEKSGYQFIGCSSGEECLEKYGKERPDLILLDIMLPGIDGWQVYERIKTTNRNQKIAFLSALGIGPQTSVKLLKLGAPEYISKPFTPDELRARVKEILEK
ncbi:MAG: response regulator [Hadesarchaea archaeon]|nr:response regulator [Hadesarchaea archaeon]